MAIAADMDIAAATQWVAADMATAHADMLAVFAADTQAGYAHMVVAAEVTQHLEPAVAVTLIAAAVVA
jgi:hypothetical protein